MNRQVFVSFDECKAKISIPEVLEILGIADQFRQRNGVWTGACPFPDHVHNRYPNTEQFKINQVDGGVWLWKCWSDDCGRASGNVVQFVMRMLNLTSQHVRFWFAENFGERLTLQRGRGQPKEEARSERGIPKRASVKQLHKTVSEGDDGFKPIRFKLRLDPDVEYLRERGITPTIASSFGIGLCERGMLSGHIAFPIWDFPHGEFPAGYIGRRPTDESDDDDRYKFPPSFPKHRFLFGINEAVEAPTRRPLIVVEGVFDVLRCAAASFPAVAALGASLSEEQAVLISDVGRPCIVLFDADDAGRTGAIEAAGRIARHTWVRTVSLEEGTDPADYSAEELTQILERVVALERGR